MFLKELQHFHKIFRAKFFLIFYLLAVLIDMPGLAVDYSATGVFVVENDASLINSHSDCVSKFKKNLMKKNLDQQILTITKIKPKIKLSYEL